MSKPRPPGQSALRRGRRSEAGRIYLLTVVTHRRQRWFAEWRVATSACRELGAACRWPGASLLCWVLMPDHWHGLVRLDRNVDLAQIVGKAKGRAARAVNQELVRTGPVWMPGFHDRALREEDDVVVAARYVIANPLRAGLVARLGDHPYWDAVWLGVGRC